MRIERVPRHDEDWSPLLNALRAGDYFVTTGEILIRRWAVEGTGARRNVVADLEWTFPLEFVEVVWGERRATGRQVVPTTDRLAFGRHRFAIPFDAAGKTWVRFAAWDSAGNGAFVPPIRLQAGRPDRRPKPVVRGL